MLTNLVFIALIGAGSVYTAAKYQKRFEETIPVCAMAVVLVLFLFGLLGVLAHGMVVLSSLAAMLYLLTAATVVKEKNLRQTLRNLLTPGAVFFMLVVALVSVCNVEMVASSWDEFSHWMDIVKAAAYVDDFGTNPAAHSTYQSYPPRHDAVSVRTSEGVYADQTPGRVFGVENVFCLPNLFCGNSDAIPAKY